MKHVKHVKYILSVDQYIKQISIYSDFGRKNTLRMNPDKIPDLHWNFMNTCHTTNIGQIDPQTTWVCTYYIDVDTLSHAEGDRCGSWCGTTLYTDKTILQSKREPIVCSVIHNRQNKM